MMNRRMAVAASWVAGIGLFSGWAQASTIAEIEALTSGTTCTLDGDAIVTAVVSQAGSFNGRNYTNWSFVVNDGTGSLLIFGAMPAGSTYTPTVGDKIAVSGKYSPYNQIPEIVTLTAISLVSQGNPSPAPLSLTIPDLNTTTPPLSIAGYMVTVDNVTISGISGSFSTSNLTGTITDGNSNAMTLYYWPTSYSVANVNLYGKPIPTWPVSITGILSVHSSTTPELIPISISSPPGVFGVVGSASPSPVVAGEATTFTAVVNPGLDPASTGVTVTANLSSIGGPAAANFVETAPGSNEFTYTLQVPCTVTAADYTLPLHVADAQLRTADASMLVTVTSGAPAISVQPSNSRVCAGGTARFSVVASGANLSYQWYNGSGALSDGENVSGATTPNLAIGNVSATEVNAGPYHVVVTADCPSAGTNLASESKTLTLGTPATPAQKQVVINQVYGGGGNSGATLKCDFIELFNKGEDPVDISGWSVQYASRDQVSSTTLDTTPNPSFGTPVRMTPIPAGTTLQPGHYYLIREAYGAGGDVDISPDLDGTNLPEAPILISNAGGKVALVNHSTPLTGPCPIGDQDCTVVDFLGWDPWTLCFEGSGAAPYTNNTSSVVRVSSCTDTDDNAADFTFTYTIVPHNSSSPAAPTIVTSPTNQSACEGQTATFTVEADGACLTYQWQVFEGGVWTNVTAGTGGDTATYTTATLAAGDIGKQYRAVVSGGYGAPATSAAATLVSGVPTEMDKQVVINQIYGGGGNNGAVYQHDFIELYNKGTTPVDLNGWSLQYASAAGHSWTNKTDLTGIIQPGQFFVIQEGNGTSCDGQPCGDPLPVTPDLIDDSPINLSATAGKLVLLKTIDVLGATSAVDTNCPWEGDCRVVDFVGFGGTANCYEGNVGAAPAPSATKSISRNPAGADTDNNAVDFVVTDPQLGHFPPGDFNHDGYVDDVDFDLFTPCITGPAVQTIATDCGDKDLDHDSDVDQADFALFQKCFAGSETPASVNCLN